MIPNEASRHHLRFCSQGLRLSYDTLDSRTKAAALQNRALKAARRQDAARIQELQAANHELTSAAAKQASAVEVNTSLPATADRAAPTDCPSSKGNRLTQVCCCLLQHPNIQQSLLVLAGRTFVNRKQVALKMSACRVFACPLAC